MRGERDVWTAANSAINNARLYRGCDGDETKSPHTHNHNHGLSAGVDRDSPEYPAFDANINEAMVLPLPDDINEEWTLEGYVEAGDLDDDCERDWLLV